MGRAKKVLILYASYGEGHRQVTAALARSFQARGMQTVTVDLYRESHPLLNAFTRFFYARSFGSWASRIYGWSYYWTRDMRQKDEQLQALFSFGIHTLKKLIREIQPDAVINTFPFAAMPVLIQHIGLNIRTYTVVTDFCLHDLWLHPEIDKYFVATSELKAAMGQKGISRERICVSGIPLRKAFTTCAREDPGLLQRIGLASAKPAILIMGGAIGLLRNTKRLCETLLRNDGIQLIVVCGKNERNRKQLTTYFQHAANVCILGYVEKMAELMMASACIVTKAGGITLSEAISLELPLLLLHPAPGQEKENAAFLAGKGAAILADDVQQAAEGARRLLLDAEQAQRMKQALRMLRHADATEAVVAEIAEDLTRTDRTMRKSAAALARSAEIARF